MDEDKFDSKVSKMGRKKIVNVPVFKHKDFPEGTKVEVKKKTEKNNGVR